MIADLIAEDREGRPVLLVEVKPVPPDDETVDWFLDELRETPEGVDFGMLVDPDAIWIYRRGEPQPVARLDAIEVLSHYSPDYAGGETPHRHQGMFVVHTQALVGAWLRDLSYGWKPGEPPKLAEIRSIGLLDRIAGGTTAEEVTLGGRPLR